MEKAETLNKEINKKVVLNKSNENYINYLRDRMKIRGKELDTKESAFNERFNKLEKKLEESKEIYKKLSTEAKEVVDKTKTAIENKYKEKMGKVDKELEQATNISATAKEELEAVESSLKRFNKLYDTLYGEIEDKKSNLDDVLFGINSKYEKSIETLTSRENSIKELEKDLISSINEIESMIKKFKDVRELVEGKIKDLAGTIENNRKIESEISTIKVGFDSTFKRAQEQERMALNIRVKLDSKLDELDGVFVDIEGLKKSLAETKKEVEIREGNLKQKEIIVERERKKVSDMKVLLADQLRRLKSGNS